MDYFPKGHQIVQSPNSFSSRSEESENSSGSAS
jgi:hypothetical protein